MATEPEISLQVKPILSPSDSLSHSTETLEQPATPWIDYAIHQSRLYQKTIEETLHSALEASKSRLSEIRSTSSAHFSQTIDSLEDVKSNYAAYEESFLAKIKEGASVAASHPMITGGVAGASVAASHPMITGGVAAASVCLVLKRPRLFLYYKTLRLFVSKESLLSRADAKVKELRHSIDVLKAESEKLEKRALHAEDELIRGRTKLRQAGKQIQSAIGAGYKIERQARGLKDSLGELPRREASLLREQVSKLASQAKQERIALSKEVAKISNYGISV